MGHIRLAYLLFSGPCRIAGQLSAARAAVVTANTVAEVTS